MSGTHDKEYMRRYMRAYRARQRQEASRLATVPPGTSSALDHLRAELKACRDTATRNRLAGAIEHLEKVLAGGKVKPRDPRRADLRIIGPVKFNARPAPAVTAVADDGSDPMKPTGRRESTWMDDRLGD